MAGDVLARLASIERQREQAEEKATKLKWRLEEQRKEWLDEYDTDDPEEIRALLEKAQAESVRLKTKLDKQVNKLEKELAENGNDD